MIWGSQYDAMLNWMQAGGKNVNATDKGNHSYTTTTTGGTDTDIINNIYDLEGNLYECTLEASGQIFRAGRGGYYKTYPASFRYDITLNTNGASNGSRLSLYIK